MAKGSNAEEWEQDADSLSFEDVANDERLSVDPDQFERLSNSVAAEKVKTFPQTPGVYLMKDALSLIHI